MLADLLSSVAAFLASMPVLVKVLASLALILLANRLVKELLVSVLIGTLLLGLWFGHGLPAVGAIAWERFRAPDSLLLIAVLLLVIWLSSLMAEGGVMRELVEAVRARVPRRLAFAALPSVIGFLPMPGGAVFSAPMVDSADPDRSLSGLVKLQTNHWFRHIWEYWWPLYPGVILALELTRLQVWQFFLVQFPMTLVAAASGALLLLRRIPRAAGGAAQETVSAEASASGASQSTAATRAAPRCSLLSLMAPILVVVVVFALLQVLLPGLQRLSRYVPMGIGLLLALAVLQLQRRLPLSAWVQAVFSWKALQITLLVVVVRIYAAVIEAPLPDGVLPVALLRRELSLFGIPDVLLVAFLPFICGFTMGSTVGYVGASFPLALSLLGPAPAFGRLAATTVLAFGAGFVGELLSPVHICLVVTAEYFHIRMLRSLASLVPPSLLVLAGVTLWQFALRWLLPG
jgi:integral membrane protein (TIGR00529 family)